MTASCPSCRVELLNPANFCPHCGQPLTAPVMEGRKRVSALFFDVVGSTSLGESFDPEDLQAMIGAGVQRAMEICRTTGGTPRAPSGDGGMALFGAPVAREDDPERAVLAGLSIVESFAAYAGEVEQRWGVSGLGVRVGIETGLVAFAADRQGEEAMGHAMGDALNTASRLESAATPGSVLVGPRTYLLVADRFSWGESQPLRLKGKADAVRAHRALSWRAQRAEQPSLATGLVGRSPELDAAAAAAAGVVAGTGAIVVLTGEAGLGKSRLLSELRHRVDGALWFEGRGLSHGQAIPHHVITDALRGWLAQSASGSSESATLGRVLGRRSAAIGPVLQSLLGAGDELAQLPPEAAQERIFSAVEEFLQALAAHTPLVIALDDLHWADQSSLALAQRLLALPQRSPVALVLASRPERDGPIRDFLRAASDQALAVTVELVPLDEADGLALVDKLVGVGTLPGGLARRLVERAAGNPLFLTELVRAIRDSDALRWTGDSWTFDEQARIELPDSVEKLVLSRADRLGVGARRILSAAAVLGRQTPADLLSDVVGGLNAPALAELERSDMLGATEAGELRFHHPLIQEAIYDNLLRSRRTDLHRAAAAALRTRPRPDHALLAGHLRAAGDDRECVEEFAMAGADAEHAGALSEAVTSYREGLKAAHRAKLASSEAVVVDLCRRAAWAMAGQGEHLGGLDLMERSLAGAQAGGHRQRELEVLIDAGYLERMRDHQAGTSHLLRAASVAAELGDHALQARALSRLSVMRANRLDLSGASDACRQAHEAADRAPMDRGAMIAALDCRKLVALHLGDISELRLATDRLLSLTGEDEVFLRPFVELERAFVPIAQAQWGEARRRAQQALTLQRTSGLRTFEPLFLDVLCWIARGARDFAEAETVGRAAHEAGLRGGFGETTATAAATLGWALLEADRAAEAVDLLRNGADTAKGISACLQELRCSAMLAWALWDTDEPGQAREALDRSLQLLAGASVPAGGVLLYAAPAILAAARVRARLGDPEGARAMTIPVAEAARRAGWVEFVRWARAEIEACDRLQDAGVAGPAAQLGSAISPGL